MKRIIYALAIVTVVAMGMIDVSCNSPSKKSSKSNQEVQDSQKISKDKQTQGNVQEKKAATAEEWKSFKSDAEFRINKNEMRIAEIKAKMLKPGKMSDSLSRNVIMGLEQKNNDLKKKIETYEMNQSDWDSFKSGFNQEMDEVEQGFNKLGTNPK